MNVVGKVGSLITQGVYSVATPFHPFGGAVDVIVVEQQDGTFRSTPWYVRFGKFQGVLKGAEKIVRVTVNGVAANFHMFLDNSGEAYFVREVESSGTKTEPDSNTCDNSNPSGSNSDSNLCKKDDNLHDNVDEDEKVEDDEVTYRLQEKHSTSEISVKSSNFTPYHYGSLDDVEDIVESSQLSNSEMVLVSIDGHVLTAPISSIEEDTEHVQLETPQFHLGPGDSSADDFASDGEEWVTSLIDNLNDSTLRPSESCSFPGVPPESVYHSSKTEVTSILNVSEKTGDDANGICPTLNRNDTFMSCIEFSELSNDKDESDSQNLSSPNGIDMEQRLSEDDSQLDNQKVLGSDVRNHDQFLNGSHVTIFCSNSTTTISSHGSSLKVEEYESNAMVDVRIKQMNCEEVDADSVYVAMQQHLSQIPSSDTEPSDRSPVMEIERGSNESVSINIEDTDHEAHPHLSDLSHHSNAQQEPEATEKSSTLVMPSATEHGDEVSESQDQEEIKTLGFEVSLCGNLLHAGMGDSAAAQAFENHRISQEEFEATGQSIIKNKNLIVRFHGKYFRWDKAAPIVLGMAVYGTNLSFNPTDALPVEQQIPKGIDDAAGASPSGRGWKLWPIPFRRAKFLQSGGSSNVEDFMDLVSQSPRTESGHDGQAPRKQCLRTNVPTTEEIESLNLKDGQNMITFSFCTMVFGKQQVDAHIYLWKWNARIVISDVDGTITRSDVLGQFMPLVGKDWSQSGVAPLFCAIKENGYQLLFLSARAIVQAYLTRSFLLNLKQDGKTLPSGPVVISPDGLFPSLYREVIRRAPHEFKIACLEDIKALFPSDYNPFYAGFGNRDTDELSYRKIGIPKGKIFIINPKGEVAINHRIDVKSYTSLHKLVNDMFPPTSIAEQEDYNSWNYWKVPLPSIDD